MSDLAGLTGPMTAASAGFRLGRGTVAALGWTAFGLLASQVLALVKSATLARLLPPEAFGLFGLALSWAGAAHVVSPSGWQHAVIAYAGRRGEERDWLDTAWTLSTLRGVVAAALVAASTPWAVRFYDRPGLAPILALLAVGAVVEGVANPALALLQRELRYRRIVLAEQAAAWSGAAVAVLVALWQPTALALALGALALAVGQTLAGYAIRPYRPRLALRRAVLGLGWRYGAAAMAVTALTYVTTQADNLLLGKLVSAAELGRYVLVYGLVMLVPAAVGSTFGRVFFPALRAEERPREVVVVLWAHGFAGLGWLLVGALALFVLLNEPLVALLWGDRWATAAPLLPVLGLAAVMRAAAIAAASALLALERPGVDARGKLYEVFLFLPLLGWWASRWGALGAAWAVAVSYTLAWAVRIAWLRRAARAVDAVALRWLAALAVVGLLRGAVVVGVPPWPLAFLAGGIAAWRFLHWLLSEVRR